MLDSTLLFFSAIVLLSFLLVLQWKDRPRAFLWASVLFGASFGAVIVTKAFGLLLILLVPFLLWSLRHNRHLVPRFIIPSALAFIAVFISVWQLHFSLGTTVNPSLPDQGYYQASERYKAILSAGQTSNPFAFPFMLRDSMAFVPHYQKGVPRLDMCKADENGSPWFYWPLGGSSINYRWETPDGSAFRYLYLQVNPVIWALGFLAVLVSTLLLIGPLLLPVPGKVKHASLMLVMLTLYACFLIAVSRIDRVLYLYHYFLPLLLTFILFALVFDSVERIGKWILNEERKTAILLGLGVLMFLSFQWFRPLTYYEPLTDAAVSRRSFLRIWNLHCVHCPSPNPLAVSGGS
jgi:dolichyl-phosphate-mannose--protein O-mannosyl transferase